MVLAKNCAKVLLFGHISCIKSNIFCPMCKKSVLLSSKTDAAIKTLSYIVRFLVGLMLVIIIGLILFTSLPASQRWLAAKVSSILSDELQTTVKIGRAQMSLFNRVVLDDVLLLDQQEDTLLTATRLSMKISLTDLAYDKFNIAAAQLFGFDIRLRRPSTEDPYNFQFIIDHFASKDTTTTPLNVTLSQVVIRRGRLSHDVLSEPHTDRFSPSHFTLDSIRICLKADTITNGIISTNISELSFTELRSSLKLENFQALLSLHLPADGPMEARISNFILLLPNSGISIPHLNVQAIRSAATDSTSIRLVQLGGSLKGHCTPSDLSPLLPLLSRFDDKISINIEGALSDDQLRIHEFTLTSDLLDVDANAELSISSNNAPLKAAADINRLQVGAPLVQRTLTLLADSGIIAPSLAKKISNLGDLQLQGNGSYTHELSACEFELHTDLGKAQLQGSITHGDLFRAHIEAKELKAKLLFNNPEEISVNNISFTSDTHGSLRYGTIQGTLTSDLHFKNEKLDQLEAAFSLSADSVSGQVILTDDHYNMRVQGNLASQRPLLSDPSVLNGLTGSLHVCDLTIHNGEDDYELEDLFISLQNDEQQRHHITIMGDFINAALQGDFSYLTLPSSLQAAMHRALPTLVPEPARQQGYKSKDQIDFAVYLWDTDSLLALADVDLKLPESLYFEGDFNGPAKTFSLKADAPHLIYGGQDLRAMSLIAHEKSDSINLFLSAQRMIESGPLDITVMADAAADVLTSIVTWDDHNTPVQRGELSTQTRFRRNEEQGINATIAIRPTQIIVADTVWDVHPAVVQLDNGVVNVHDFQVSQLGRHLKVDGRVSSNPEDTLYADLRHINLQYVFGIIDFHDVEFEGLATGKVRIANFSDIPRVDGLLDVDDFVLNGGLLGHLVLDIGFGRKDDRAIDIDGLIRDKDFGHLSHVVGIVKPGREPGRGMDLHIYATHLNAYFINYFTEGIFDRIEGRATGYTHLYGPFGELDLEGDLVLDTVSLGVPVLGTRYHTHGGDSIHMRPGSIYFSDVHLFDAHHESDSRRHEGILNGALRFEHFENLRYNFNLEAHDLLGYDFRTFGDQSFYGTAFADGTVVLSGEPGTLNVDIQCTPTAGTIFTYNVSTPETMTDNEFITFKKKAAPVRVSCENPTGFLEASNAKATQPHTGAVLEGSSMGAVGGGADEPNYDEPTDMHINFDLNITPVAQMRLLMDPRAEDYINLWGDGHIRATFYNKGRFQMYGTYRVDRGNYRLSLQDFIRKEFQFEQGSSIVFGGNPLQGDLNLKAIYTVPGVSLNDLASGSNFSSASVRVNCIMNIGGRAENPQISFDFDIPNVNEDEKQMVRSLISTDEERNLQVIYLLGIGRFYKQDLAANENQANTAMQSLLSSTLSGQLNNILSNAIGSSNWNFGTSFSTGQLGWQDMDVEGSLSGRLFNNRLLVNGTFGYRDTPVANTNFIGDFDVRYLITPSGSISLKAYSETNDRYFTKSALTTQGIGIMLKKDFNGLRDLFRRRK